MSDYERTHLYGGNANDKTGVYSNARAEVNKTGVYSSEENKTRKTSQGLSVGDKIQLKDSEYSLINVISDDSGEAILYKMEDSSGTNLNYFSNIHFQTGLTSILLLPI